MLVLFIIGAFGIKAGLVAYGIYRVARFVNSKGNDIRKKYEDEISNLKEENRRLQKPIFVQRSGVA